MEFFTHQKPDAGDKVVGFLRNGRLEDPYFAKFLRMENSVKNQGIEMRLRKEEVNVEVE